MKGFLAESYRLGVPELKSVGWQCVGTKKIQDGCRDPGKKMGMDKIKSYLYTISQSSFARFWLLLVKMEAILNFGHMNILGHYYKRFI